MNECNIPHAPSTGLNDTQYSTLNSAGINDPAVKYKNLETLKFLIIQTNFEVCP
jgi:hypothetical protein